ncbi:MAG: tetratricopeptide repeat protein, partial [Planctomycetota bacterium]
SDKYRVPFICLALACVTLAVYWQVLSCEFITFDDPHYVTENHYVRTGFTLSNIKWAFTPAVFGYWHPLTWLSHMLDCHLFGVSPVMHHLINLLIHVANSLILFLVFKRMTGAVFSSAFVAAVFALHPLNVESVAWVTERKNVLSTLFWLLTMWVYTDYVRRGGLLRYSVALLLFALGLLAKPMLVTLPFVLLLLDYWPFERFRPGRNFDEIGKDNEKGGVSSVSEYRRPVLARLILEKVPFFALSLISAYLSSLSVRRLGINVSTKLVPVRLRIANALTSYMSYIGKMLWPRKLAVFYPYPDTVPLWQAIVALLVLICISVLMIWVFRSRRYPAVGWLWYLGALIPVSGLVQAGLWPAMADRWAYVPLVGLFTIIAWGVPDLLAKLRHRNIVLGTTALMVLLALSVCTNLQLRHWRSSIALFQHTIEVTEDNYQAHFSMIKPLRQQGRTAGAIEHGYKALKINPNYPSAHNSLGAVLIDSGEINKAIAHLRRALQLKPDFPAAHVNLGAALFKQGDLDEATRHFYEALQLDTNSFGAHINLATIFMQLGEIEKAVEHYTEAARIKPDFVDAHNNLGYALARQGRFNEAVRHYSKALRIGPESAGLHNVLAVVLTKQGKIDQAITHFKQALRLDPDAEDVRANLNAILALMKQAEPNEPNQP